MHTATIYKRHAAVRVSTTAERQEIERQERATVKKNNGEECERNRMDKEQRPEERNSVLQYLRIVVCDYRLSEALLTNQSDSLFLSFLSLSLSESEQRFLCFLQPENLK